MVTLPDEEKIVSCLPEIPYHPYFVIFILKVKACREKAILPKERLTKSTDSAFIISSNALHQSDPLFTVPECP